MYATDQDLYTRFGQSEIDTLADRNGDGQPDPGVLDGALQDASEEMDSYFRTAGLVTPVSQTPLVTARICCNLARYSLYTIEPPPAVVKLHDDAIAWLKAVAAGTISLGVAADGSEPVVQDDITQFQSQPNAFSRDSTSDEAEYGWGDLG